MKHLLSACMLLLLAGCSIVSKDQCKNLNWYGRGYADALRGEPYSQGSRYISACRDQGIYLDIAPWQRGYQHNLNQMCPLNKARTLANSPQSYQGPCLAIPTFASAYHAELAKAQERAVLQKAEDDLVNIRREHAALRGKQDATSKARLQELEWSEFQLQQTLLELRPPVAVEGDVLNPSLH
jgi:hypothetical protein